MKNKDEIRRLKGRIRNLEHMCKFTMATIKEHGMLKASSACEDCDIEELEDIWKEFMEPIYVSLYNHISDYVSDEGLEEYQEMVWNNK